MQLPDGFGSRFAMAQTLFLLRCQST
jgi:hypothetical protein